MEALKRIGLSNNLRINQDPFIIDGAVQIGSFYWLYPYQSFSMFDNIYWPMLHAYNQNIYEIKDYTIKVLNYDQLIYGKP